MKSLPRQRLLLLASGVLVGLLALDRLVIGPGVAHWRARTTEIAALERTLAAGRGVIEGRDRTDAAWRRLREGALPSDPSLAEQRLLSALENGARAEGVELTGLRPRWRKASSGDASLLECRLDATGSFPALVRLLGALEKSPLALRVESIELTARDEGGQRLALALSVTGLRFAPLETRP
ncbi:MAG: VOC family protein [Verrucomicrobia bacterium]|nr:VOC family protein [Verrucomicrobiota bacterium]